MSVSTDRPPKPEPTLNGVQRLLCFDVLALVVALAVIVRFIGAGAGLPLLGVGGVYLLLLAYVAVSKAPRLLWRPRWEHGTTLWLLLVVVFLVLMRVSPAGSALRGWMGGAAVLTGLVIAHRLLVDGLLTDRLKMPARYGGGRVIDQRREPVVFALNVLLVLAGVAFLLLIGLRKLHAVWPWP